MKINKRNNMNTIKTFLRRNIGRRKHIYSLPNKNKDNILKIVKDVLHKDI